jgi:hypothetical protein
MVESRGWNIVLWFILMIAGAVLGRIAGYNIGGEAFSGTCGWIGFGIAVIGFLIMIWDWANES